jgi:acetyl-CoA carboxylase, biotin carboxylase subunit
MFRKVLIANRGEIAVRIARTLRELEVRSVAVFSDPDRNALHVKMADEAYPIGGSRAADSYLRGDKLIAAALQAGCEAVIPGYGFLSENAEFARNCAAHGLVFVGPPPEAMATMGLKPAAREHMARAGVPIVPGGPAQTLEEARTTSERIGFPLLFKAAAGGGGRGMRRIDQASELASNFERAQSEALSAFGDGTIYIERLVSPARHIEIQVLGDQHGNLVHLFERDCSVQRRHQKVVEESPSPALPAAAREALCQTALRGARSVGYYSVGTFEFLVDAAHQHYFLEMNTRLQVEHPVTELLCGVDLVAEMLRVAAGERLRFSQEQLVPRGAAIECRLYAEDPRRGFLPSPGPVLHFRAPAGPGVRIDAGVEQGSEVGPEYDPLLAKLCVWAHDRPSALGRMRRALGELELEGLVTNLDLHRALLRVPAFVNGVYDTGFIANHLAELTQENSAPPSAELAAAVLALQHVLRAPSSAAEPSAPSTSQWQAAHRRARLGL